jgi:putative endonuclease
MYKKLSKKEIGKYGERIATKLLKNQGHTILKHNHHSRYGEIDVVSHTPIYYPGPGQIHFTEVKTRFTDSINHPLETITPKKRKRLLLTAIDFLEKNDIRNKSWRIVLIGILLRRDFSIEKIYTHSIFDG